VLLLKHLGFKGIFAFELFNIERVNLVLPLPLNQEVIRASRHSDIVELPKGAYLLDGWLRTVKGRGQVFGLLIPFLFVDFKCLDTSETRYSIEGGLPHRLLALTLPELLGVFFDDHISFSIEETNGFL
jgi:hypothetical protein